MFTQPFIQGTDHIKHKSTASLAFVREIHRSLVNSPHKGPVKRKMLTFDYVIIVMGIKIKANEFFSCLSSSAHWSFAKWVPHPLEILDKYDCDFSSTHYRHNVNLSHVVHCIKSTGNLITITHWKTIIMLSNCTESTLYFVIIDFVTSRLVLLMCASLSTDIARVCIITFPSVA